MALFTAAGLALLLTPTQKLAAQRSPGDLESLIPRQFGAWREDQSIRPLMVNPAAQATIAKYYQQTLARIYVDGRGMRVMLSIAYGGDQSDTLRVHRPETCYAVQGFQISRRHDTVLRVAQRQVPARRLIAVRGERVEPITYWITTGDRVVISGLQQKLAQMRYSLSGRIPDGLLMRVSSIGNDADAAYRLQQEFLDALLSALSEPALARLLGVHKA